MTDPPLIYVVDDEAELRALMVEALETEGYTVEGLADGRTLLVAIEQAPPDLILLDINLPGLSGWEVQRELQTRPGMTHVPVIAVTAQGGESIEASARRGLGFFAFVHKPFRLAELLDRAREGLEARAARRV